METIYQDNILNKPLLYVSEQFKPDCISITQEYKNQTPTRFDSLSIKSQQSFVSSGETF